MRGPKADNERIVVLKARGSENQIIYDYNEYLSLHTGDMKNFGAKKALLSYLVSPLLPLPGPQGYNNIQ